MNRVAAYTGRLIEGIGFSELAQLESEFKLWLRKKLRSGKWDSYHYFFNAVNDWAFMNLGPDPEGYTGEDNTADMANDLTKHLAERYRSVAIEEGVTASVKVAMELVAVAKELMAAVPHKFHTDAAEIMKARDITRFDEAYDYLNDDRSHGNDALADCANQLRFKHQHVKSPLGIERYIAEVLLCASGEDEAEEGVEWDL